MSAQYDNSFSSSSNILDDSDDDATAAVKRCSAPEASSLTDRHGKLVDAAASFLRKLTVYKTLRSYLLVDVENTYSTRTLKALGELHICRHHMHATTS